jgi:hypothetical protein
MDDLLGIADHSDVRAVRHHDDLSALFYLLDNRDQQPVNRLAVEILFGLVNNDGYRRI